MSTIREQTKATVAAALGPFLAGGVGGTLQGSLNVTGQFMTTDGKINDSLLISETGNSTGIKLSADGTNLTIGGSNAESIKMTIDPQNGTVEQPGVLYCQHIDSGSLDADTTTSTSDIRLKDDIVNFDCNLSELHAKQYTLKSDGKRHVGLIAQTVKKTIPDAVVVREDGYYGLDYNAVVAVLVNKVNDLQRQVDELHKKVKQQ